ASAEEEREQESSHGAGALGCGVWVADRTKEPMGCGHGRTQFYPRRRVALERTRLTARGNGGGMPAKPAERGQPAEVGCGGAKMPKARGRWPRAFFRHPATRTPQPEESAAAGQVDLDLGEVDLARLLEQRGGVVDLLPVAGVAAQVEVGVLLHLAL